MLSTNQLPLIRSDKPLSGAVALVTGGGRGLGLMLAKSFAESGASVALVARSANELAEAVRLVEKCGGVAAHVAADVTDAGELTAAIAELERLVGPADVLVNNAGIVGPIGPMWEVGANDWWRAMEVNLRGVLLATQLVLPGMVARRRGRIINITSRAGAYRWPLVSAYSVSKSAVVKLSENLAHEASQFGVSVFSVHPGLLPIGLTELVLDGPIATAHEERIRDWTRDELRNGRGADPERAVDLIVRLAAGDADALSGRHLSVHDDLDTILARVNEVHERDLFVMRPELLAN